MKNYSFKDILSKISDLEYVERFDTNERTLTQEEIVNYTVELIEARMNLCSTKLFIHLKNAKLTMNNQQIVWEGGHFSFPAYLAMDKFLECPTFDNIICNPIVAMQAWKQLSDSFDGLTLDKFQMIDFYAGILAQWRNIR